MMVLFHAIVLGLLALVLVHTVLNHRVLPRLARARLPTAFPPIAVLIPARDEAQRIASSVRRWARQTYPDYEVVVFDDDSLDDTAARATAAAAGARHVRVIRGRELPLGWRGKPHACHRLRDAVQAEVLVFADADVLAAPETLARTAGALATLGVDALSALPAHESPSLAVRALVALQNWASLAIVPSWLPAARRSSLFVALNGQFLAIRASAYDASGGFAAVRSALAEDAALGRRLVASGHTVGLLDGAGLLICRPYARVHQAWSANVRNLGSVFFGSTPLLLVVAAALAALYLVPLLVLGFAVARGASGALLTASLAIAEIVLGVLSRAISDRRAGYPHWLALLHPLAIGALVAMCLEAAARAQGKRSVEWRGRRYDLGDRAA